MATRIICRATDCIFWENKLCTSDEIIYDPDEGCLTYEVLDDLVLEDEDDDEDWDDDELIIDDEDEDDDLWDDEDEDEDLFLDDDFDDDNW